MNVILEKYSGYAVLQLKLFGKSINLSNYDEILWLIPRVRSELSQ
jgi:hypothetical protein